MELNFDIRTIFKALKDHIIIILIVGLLFALGAGIYSSTRMEEKYTCTTVLQMVKTSKFEDLPMVGDIIQKQSKGTDAISRLQKYLSSTENDGFGKYPNMTEAYLQSVISVKSDESGFLTYTVTTEKALMSYDIACAIYKVFPEVFEVKGDLDRINVPLKTLQKPILPTSPSSPNVKLYTVVAGVAGIFVSWLFFFLISLFDVSVITKKDLSDTFNYPVIGEIPIWERSGK